MTTRALLREALVHYTSAYAEEQIFREQFLELLLHPRAFFRDHLPGHITGSSWVVDETGTHTLLTHHAKLNKWLQPGGHADGEEHIENVALREAHEETGLKNLKLAYRGIFDIDIHTIPSRKDFPEHLHFDIRFLVKALRTEPLVITEESYDLRWIDEKGLQQLCGGNRSMLRMAEKAKRLLRPHQQ